MNVYSSIPRRGPKAEARRERILAEYKSSGLSAYAFARQYPLPYTTLVKWLKRPRRACKNVAITEIELPAPSPEPCPVGISPSCRVTIVLQSEVRNNCQ